MSYERHYSGFSRQRPVDFRQMFKRPAPVEPKVEEEEELPDYEEYEKYPGANYTPKHYEKKKRIEEEKKKREEEDKLKRLEEALEKSNPDAKRWEECLQEAHDMLEREYGIFFDGNQPIAKDKTKF